MCFSMRFEQIFIDKTTNTSWHRMEGGIDNRCVVDDSFQLMWKFQYKAPALIHCDTRLLMRKQTPKPTQNGVTEPSMFKGLAYHEPLISLIECWRLSTLHTASWSSLEWCHKCSLERRVSIIITIILLSSGADIDKPCWQIWHGVLVVILEA